VPIARGKLEALKQQQKDISDAVTELSDMIQSVSSELPK
jgi:hypothetical protein